MLNKTVIITGASQGIGEAIARKLAQEGYHTILTIRQFFYNIVEIILIS
jgi:short-subunit dehydrogenase